MRQIVWLQRSQRQLAEMEEREFWSPVVLDLSLALPLNIYLPLRKLIYVWPSGSSSEGRTKVISPSTELVRTERRGYMKPPHAVLCTQRLDECPSWCSVGVLFTRVPCFYFHFLSPEVCCKFIILMTFFRKHIHLLCEFSQLARALILLSSLIHPCPNPLHLKLPPGLHCQSPGPHSLLPVPYNMCATSFSTSILSLLCY